MGCEPADIGKTIHPHPTLGESIGMAAEVFEGVLHRPAAAEEEVGSGSVALNLICETVGSGPPLVVLHGLFGSSGNWRGVARALAGTHTVVSVDLRNHGASPWADSMDYVEMADDVLQLIDRLELKRPAVIGHSMGGKVAMALALRRPARIARLIVVDIAPVSYADTLTPFAEAMRSADVMAAASRSEVQRRLQQAVPG